MIGNVFLNGRFIPAAQAQVSIFDRGWMYGDGLFETLRVANGKPFQWDLHWDRLSRGLEFLQLRAPFSSIDLRQAAEELSRINGISEGVLRLAVSRGVGPRGYSPRGAEHPTWVMTLAAFSQKPNGAESGSPSQWRLVTSRQIRLQPGALASMKTANRLPQILARREAEEAGVEEALVCNVAGQVAEASSGNVFWIREGRLFTPPIESGGLPGIARSTIVGLASSLGVPVSEVTVRPDDLLPVEGMFISLSTYGVIEVVGLDGTQLRCHPLTRQLWQSWEALVAAETSGKM
ncbi:MAG: aminodeoxychorismate lyase [Verrucomicrobiales bacterium]|nr:aminodeoxychorismate lyase [Verrucomicrobiales bacterium]